MKKLFGLLLILAGIVTIGVVTVIVLTPWMDRWGASESEIAATLPGDELVPAPTGLVNRAITIHAAPEQIFPWLLQLGADKGGMYSYTELETLINCPQVNADRIHPEWQNLQVGDVVRMCPKAFGPPPYQVALIIPNQALVVGHQDGGRWTDVWQLVLVPQTDGNTRLVQRTRTLMAGGIWDVIHPGIFIMERRMMLGIKERAEMASNGGRSESNNEESLSLRSQ